MSEELLETTYAKKQIVVTGGASFIGSHLVEALIDLGANVIVIDNLSSGKIENLPTKGFEFVNLDLHESPSKVVRMFQKIRPNSVFHLAAVHGGRGFIEKFPNLILPNLSIDNNVFGAAIECEAQMIVHASSACAYPTTLQTDKNFLTTLSEDSAGFAQEGQAFPDGIYGWVKLIGELQLSSLTKNSVTSRGRSARIFTAFGERENESHAAIALIAKSLLRLDPFPIWGDGQQTRNFTYVQDTVKGLLLLGADSRSLNFDVFNVGTSSHIRVIDFVKEIHRLLRFQPKKFDFQVDKPVGVAARAANNEKMLTTFGWTPSTAVILGIEKTLNWYKKKGNRPNTVEELELLLLARG
jgi:nucleoside-diphosphate-sugar epimerase